MTDASRHCFPSFFATVFWGLYVAVCAAEAGAWPPDEVVNTFDRGRQSWQIYDYNGGAGSENVFYLPTWEKSGGVENSEERIGVS